MQSAKDQIIRRSYVLSDLLALLVAFLAATAFAGQIETGIAFPDTLTQRYSIGNIAGFVVLVGLWLLVYQRMGLYQPRKPLLYRPRKAPVDLVAEAAAIGAASAIGSTIFAAASSIFHITLLTPLFFSVFFPSVTILGLLLRKAVQYSLKNLTLGDRNQRNILVVGSNEIAFNYANMIKTGQKLNPVQRKDFYDSAKAINESFQAEKATVGESYKKLAGQYGFKPENVIFQPSKSNKIQPTGTIDFSQLRK